MSAVQEVEKLLSRMSRAEKAELLHLVIRDLAMPSQESRAAQTSVVARPVLFGPVYRFGCSSKPGASEARRPNCSESTRHCVPKTSSMPGPMCALIKTRSIGRFERTKLHSRWRRFPAAANLKAGFNRD